MSLDTPTVAGINAQIISQLEAALNQTIPLVPKSFNRALAKTLAAVFVMLWKYGGFIFLQQFVATATIEEVTINGRIVSPLKEWGRLSGVGDPVAAVPAELLVDIAVETQGGTLASGSPLVNSASGVTYILIGSVELNAATVEGTILAVGDQGGGNGAGAIGNVENGGTVSFANPPAEVFRDVAVTATLTTGANTEDTEVYRQRIVDRFQKRPQGGALIDYEAWGEEVAGILNVYPYTGALSGEIDVFVEATAASSGSADGIPTQVQLDQVAESIALDVNGLASRQPAGPFVNVNAITREGFDITVQNIAGVDNLASTKVLIEEALTEYLAAREPFISGVTQGPRRDSVTTAGLTGVVEDIVAAGNGQFNGLNFKLTSGGGVIFAHTLGQGEKVKLTLPVAYLA